MRCTPVLFTTVLMLLLATRAGADGVPYLRQPTISHDGTVIAFVYSGDIFEVAAAGGHAQVRVQNPAYDSRPCISPSGEWLAFTSTRTGNGDVYVQSRHSGELRRLTWHDAADLVEDWSPDSRFIYFSSSRHEIAGYADIFCVSITGSTPVCMSGEPYEGEYNAAVSPNGQHLAFNSNDRGRQWWRKGQRRSDATEIWMKSNEPDALDYVQVTSFAGKDSWPMWAPDGRGLYFVTDEGHPDGTENLAYQSLSGHRRQITRFDTGRVLWPDIASDGTIVFERDLRIWICRENESPRPVDIRLDTAAVSPPDTTAVENEVSEFALSPSRDQLAIILQGDIFLASPAEVLQPRRLTRTPAPEQSLHWSPDGRSLIYSSLRDGYFDVYQYDVSVEQELRLTRDRHTNVEAQVSPDGRWLVYARGTEGLTITDSSGRTAPKKIDAVMLEPRFAWSPDGRWLAYFSSDSKWFSNVFLTRPETTEPDVQVSFLANCFFGALLWSRDGSSILFDSYHERGKDRIFRVDLQQAGDQEDSEGDPHAVVASGWRRRTQVLGPVGAVLQSLSPDGTQVVWAQVVGERSSLWVGRLEWDELSESREVASGGDFDQVQWQDDRNVWYRNGGRLFRLDTQGGVPHAIEIPLERTVDVVSERVALFREAWTALRDYLGNATFNALDWQAEYDKYLPYVEGVGNDTDFTHVFNLMIGDLNASHVGLHLNSESPAPKVADLGIDFDQEQLHARGAFQIKDIIPGSPADRAGLDNVQGMYLCSIDSIPLSPESNIHRILQDKIDEPILLHCGSAPSFPDGRTWSVRGSSSRSVNRLRYEQWVDWNAAYVDSLSQSRLGYLHRPHFGTGSIEEMQRQLGSDLLAKEGLIIDIRYNGGGWASALAAELLRRPATHTSTFRDRVTTATAIIHGIHLVDLPTILVQNEQCLSDAENFSETYHEMHLGEIVGMPTGARNAGGRRYRLFNGATVRVGAWKAVSASGEDMSQVPRPVDVLVDRPIGEGLMRRDTQLEEGVQVLLKRIESR